MTKQEFQKKYGDIEIKFHSYWKYSFTFSGTTKDGHLIYCVYGGNHDDIYRFGVEACEVLKIKDLDFCVGYVLVDGYKTDWFDEF